MLNKSPWCSTLCGSTGACIMCNTTVKDGDLHLAGITMETQTFLDLVCIIYVACGQS